jgi:short-subunit dehydrogenase
MVNKMKVKNKKIIVTGAGSGIGRELTKNLISKGAYVAALDINEANLVSLKEELNTDHLYTYIVDVSNDESINKFKSDYYSNNTDIDILINNAGIIQPFKRIDELDINTINRVMNINFYGPLKLTKLFLPDLLKRPEGHIVNVSSMGGFFPFPGQTVYGASKAALKLFTEGLYSELLNTNVHVTVVYPGAVNTNIASNSNIETNSSESSSYKMLSAEKAAQIIVEGIEQNKFQLYVGSDSKMMNLMYKFSPKKAIKLINKKMGNMIK